MGVAVDSAKKKSWFMPAFFMVVWMFTLGSAIGVVYSTYESRKATQELETLRRKASGLNVVSGQLLLERSSLTAYARVEGLAEKQLSMKRPGPDRTVLVYRQ